MSRLNETPKGWSIREEVVLNLVSLAIALGFIVLVIKNVRMAGNFISIDSLFITTVFLLLAGVFLISPAMWAYANGYLKNPFGAGAGAAVVEEGPIHFEGTARLFMIVWGWLLVLTAIEVFLAYKQVSLHLMLTILIGLSVIKAVLIVAYFMHLRFERLSLVLTLVPMLVVCICLLLVFFPDSFRALALRPYR
ncbi:MAG TPA: cytochrome C oxidase subunit IV family protein [Pyrinomonadaceae bacterium]|jgi:cytochrome c oxidase subunit 4|nr:cytochrome C oxidase subunit IV family protein [Pyrinomonadaceae bacterium]